MKEEKKKAVSSIISEDAIRRWHIFALETNKKKAEALEEIIKRGTKKK